MKEKILIFRCHCPHSIQSPSIVATFHQTWKKGSIDKYCQGLTVWLNFMLKFIGKTNRLLILIIPCISDRNLFILAFILLNLIQKWPSSKIDHFPHLRIHLLYTDQLFCLIVTWINSFYLSLLSLFMPIACFAYVMHGSMH